MRVRYGYFPWWPQDGDEWLHPEDIRLARRLIPSPRVFRREDRPGGWAVLRYGGWTLRVRPTLWQEVAGEGYEIGDWVEVLSRCGQQTPRTGVIREMLWDSRARALAYQLEEAGTPIPTRYHAGDFRPVELPDAERLGGWYEPRGDAEQGLDEGGADGANSGGQLEA